MLRPVWDVSADQRDMGQKPREDSPTSSCVTNGTVEWNVSFFFRIIMKVVIVSHNILFPAIRCFSNSFRVSQ